MPLTLNLRISQLKLELEVRVLLAKGCCRFSNLVDRKKLVRLFLAAQEAEGFIFIRELADCKLKRQMRRLLTPDNYLMIIKDSLHRLLLVLQVNLAAFLDNED